MTDTHLTTPTRFIEVDGDQFAYRRWGNASTDQPPLASVASVSAMPLISAGMGLAALLASTLFLWALLAAVFAEPSADDADVEKFAFGSAAVVFSMLSAVSIVNSDPATLLASTVYLAALILSWSATRVEVPLQSHEPSEDNEPVSIQVARAMAGDAAHENQLGRLTGRELA